LTSIRNNAEDYLPINTCLSLWRPFNI